MSARSVPHQLPEEASRPRPDRHEPGAIRRAIALTVLYADLFDYPLTVEETYRRLVEIAPRRGRFERALESMVGDRISRRDGYLTWKGREHLVEVRRRRETVSRDQRRVAERYAGWLRWIPFVRMVALSGALAQNNAQAHGDVDVFCVTDPDRLWLTRLWLVPLARFTRAVDRWCPLDLCPNYLLTTATLEVDSKNLFTAYESVQADPLWGGAVYRAFRRSNDWITAYLPQTRGVSEPADEAHKPELTRAIEWVLGGRLGDLLDRGLHRLSLALFRRRAVRNGWDWSRIRPAYRRNRYTVPMGGYADVIRDLLERAAGEEIPDEVSEALLERLFPEQTQKHRRDGSAEEHDRTTGRDESSRYAWRAIFERDYPAHVESANDSSEPHASAP